MSGGPNLYPILESTIEPLDRSDESLCVLSIAKELAKKFREAIDPKSDPLAGIQYENLIPAELLPGVKKSIKTKIDPLTRLKELSVDEAEEEEETETEDQDDEENVEDEEEDAGGDYLVSHFDNGENYSDHDDEGEDDVI